MGGVGTAVQHHGKELSYNNYLDADAAYSAGAGRSNRLPCGGVPARLPAAPPCT